MEEEGWGRVLLALRNRGYNKKLLLLLQGNGIISSTMSAFTKAFIEGEQEGRRDARKEIENLRAGREVSDEYLFKVAKNAWSLLGMSVLPANQMNPPEPDQRNAAPRSHPGTDPPSSNQELPSVRVGQRAPERDPVGTTVQAEKPKKCPFSGEVKLSPAQLHQSAISKLQCPECGATWAARIRGDTVLFPSHPPRITKVRQDIS